jgi:hypothetical protein
MLKKIKLSILFIFSLLLISCAFGTRIVNLENPKCCQAEDFAGELNEKKRTIKIQFNALKDKRKEINSSWFEFKSKKYDLIGHVRNTYYMPTANVYSYNSVTKWINSAIKNKIINEGYLRIDDLNSESNYSNKDISIEGNLLLVYTDSYFNYEGKIYIEIVFKSMKTGEILFAKFYESVDTSPNFAATSEGFKEVLERSLNSIINNIFWDLENLYYKK